MLDDLFDKLAAPFPPDAISWRVGSTNIDKQTNEPRDGKPASGLALAYLDARDVMERLDLVCGPDGWQNRYTHVGGTAVCEIGVRICRQRDRLVDAESNLHQVTDLGAEWLFKADGAGATDVEAEKGMLSDAFKRAAVRWGIGRYLYGLPSPWVDLQKQGRTWVIKKDQYAKLRQLLSTYTGISPKSSAQSQRDQDYEWFKQRLAEAPDLETLGAIGREIKTALPGLPVAVRDPLSDAYLARREELMGEPEHV
jgi:hypothetical protein